MTTGIVSLYQQMRDDLRLQRDWERNQPRVDRALEAVLIARESREVATAVLLSIKLRCEPGAALLQPLPDERLLSFARSQGRGGCRLAKLIEAGVQVDEVTRAAAIHALQYYRDRSDPNPLVRLNWSAEGLRILAGSPVEEIIRPPLQPTWARRKAAGIRELAALLVQPPFLTEAELRQCLRAIPGLGPERADAAGVFAFRRGWPIVDEYLWRLLGRHGLIPASQRGITRYDHRCQVFEVQWQELVASQVASPDKLAATLYLWACEAERFGFSFRVG